MRNVLCSPRGRVPAVFGALLAISAWIPAARAADSAKPVDFNREIRPILADHCFSCHGPDEKSRKAKLRLDRREDAFALRNGAAAFVVGKADDSEALQRVKSKDADEVMPPPAFHKPLSKDQISTLERWVSQGAPWREHWAFATPTKAPEPKVKDANWARNPIDRFILARLESEGLTPSAPADRITLIRRITLDLTGLPPTPSEVDAFLADHSPNAYEKVVDRLLASPRYGEHSARLWLDAARYGDTHGLHLDNYREMWPYRDWVINAFNNNKPFDQFLVEQIAGDLLPNATLDQIVATGFNRNHVTTSEGGSIEEEVYVRNVVDRIDTTGTVFLGLTVGCARCHDHKYDPIRMKDYYQFFAFFNNIEGSPLDGNISKHQPIVQVPSAQQTKALASADAEIAKLRDAIKKEVATIKYDDSRDAAEGEYARRADYVWVDDALPQGAKVEGPLPWNFGGEPDAPVASGKASVPIRDGKDITQVVFSEARPKLKVGDGDVFFAYVFLDPINPPKEIMLQWNTEGWNHRAYWGQNLIDWGRDEGPQRRKIGELPPTGKWVRLEVPVAQVGLRKGIEVHGLAFTQHGGTAYWDKAGLETYTPQDGQTYESLASWVRAQKVKKGDGLPADIQAVVKLDRKARSDAQAKQLRAYFVENAYAPARSSLGTFQKQLVDAQQRRNKINDEIPTTLVFKERAEIKQAFMLDRGEYDRKRDKVDRAPPAFLGPLPKGAPANRLGLAKWMVAPENPLVSRVEANRLWQQMFGTGLAKTVEDLGLQGEPPSHPELLDWLAVSFREDGWDIKKFLRRIALSSTYQQSSKVTKDRLAKDPANRLLSRGARYRLDAENIRDQALFASGLLIERVGGPSVKPPQPAGLWEAVGYVDSNTAKFTADTGREKVHRRSFYTFWKRTSPPPQMTTFDAPSREACMVRRERTNTPLQALLLMNETQYVEAARALAERSIKEGGANPKDRLTLMFRLLVARKPDESEMSELLHLYEENLAVYGKDAADAKKLIHLGETKPDPALNPAELAATTMVANLVLNLDEAVNKE